MNPLRRAAVCAGLAGLVLVGANAEWATQSATKKAEKKHIEVKDVPANPEDVGSIDAIIKATYETISGGVGVPRQWERDQSLFDPNARFLAVVRREGMKEPQVVGLTHQQYVDGSNDSMVKEGFTERELGRKTMQYGNVATVLSSYEGKMASTGKIEARGVNIFTLYNDGKRWWILAIEWDEETAGNPIPADLLPKK